MNGKRSIYSGVPAATADDVSNSWSIGKALRDQIKPFHKHRYAD
jgi:hypothetical protein